MVPDPSVGDFGSVGVGGFGYVRDYEGFLGEEEGRVRGMIEGGVFWGGRGGEKAKKKEGGGGRGRGRGGGGGGGKGRKRGGGGGRGRGMRRRRR